MYILGRFIFFLLSKIFFNYKAYGRDNIPRKGAFIIASNHASYLDPIFIGIGSFRILNFMAKEALFKNPFFGALIRSTHAFAVKRGFQDIAAMREAVLRLERGKPLLVFPESTRTLDGNLQFEKTRGGVGFLASETGVPVIPAYIDGSFKVWPRGTKFINSVPVKVYFGESLDFKKFSGAGTYRKLSDAYKPFADFVMQKIAKLKQKAEHNED